MFTRTITVFFVAVLSISWGQASVVQKRHKEYEPLYPALFDLKHENMEPQDDMGRLPPSDENLVTSLHDYLICPSEKYLKVFSNRFIFKLPPRYEPDEMYIFWNSVSVKDFLKKPKTRERFVMNMIHAALNKLRVSCDELEKTINPLIINYESTPTENASGLNTKQNQFYMKFILLQANSATLVLRDLHKRMDFYKNNIDLATQLEKKIIGLNLQELLRYTDSVINSVRGYWTKWLILSHYFNVAKP